MDSPFSNFKRVPKAQELLDYAFSKASQKTASVPATIPNLEKVKRKEIKRIENSMAVLDEKLNNLVKSVPNLEELPPFYRQLSNLLVNNDDLRRSLGRISGTRPIIKRLEKEYCRKIGMQNDAKRCGLLRMEFFGRISSVIKKQESTLGFLEECRLNLLKVPPIDLSLPSVVIAGYPNVGKSTMVGTISSAKPQISEYPFTTKQIFLGLYKDQWGSKFFQVIDTPGILDRPMYERNNIEKQAILTLNTVATIVLFIFDPTQYSGYEIERQIALLKEIEKEFADPLQIPVKIIINKIDLASQEEIEVLLKALNIQESDAIMISAKENRNTDIVLKYLLAFFKDRNYRR